MNSNSKERAEANPEIMTGKDFLLARQLSGEFTLNVSDINAKLEILDLLDGYGKYLVERVASDHSQIIIDTVWGK